MKENNRASEKKQLEQDKEIHFAKELDQEAFMSYSAFTIKLLRNRWIVDSPVP